MSVTATTTHQASCDRDGCRWARIFDSRREAVAAEVEHAKLHFIKKGDSVRVSRRVPLQMCYATFDEGVVETIWYDQGRCVVKTNKDEVCHACPEHDRHLTGRKVSHSLPILCLDKL